MSKKTSRLSPPALPDSVIERPEVNRAIDAAMKKSVVYIHAPAGFGKTIAMSLWLSEKGLPAAWIPLTVYDDEPVTFCRYLLTALAEVDAGAYLCAKNTLADPSFADAPFEYFFRTVSSISEEYIRGIIVIDDFQLVENSAILNNLPLLIKKLSQMHKLVILSRLKPPVALYDLAIKNELGELSESALRFTRRQIIGLYKSYGIILSYNEAAEIEEKTGGWALGLGAELLPVKARGNESFTSRASGEKYIDGYLKREIWDKWDAGTQEFLLKTSMLEDLTPELCDRLCRCDSEKILSGLMNDSGLVVRLSDGSFRHHHILRDFLRRIATEQDIDLAGCYIISADYLLEKGRFGAALDYYVKSKDLKALDRFLYRIVDYDSARGSVEEYCNSFTNLILKKMPVEILENNILVLPTCVWACQMNGNIEQYRHWHSKLMARMDKEESIDPQLLAGLTLLLITNPLIHTRDVLKYKTPKVNELVLNDLRSPSITYNFPFFHRSHRDYTDIAGEWQEFAVRFISAFDLMSGGMVSLTMEGAATGILYEQNKLSQAHERAIKLLNRLDQNSHPELLFSAQMHLAAIAFAEADEASAWDAVNRAQTVVEGKGLYLSKNLNAIITKYRIYKGSRDAAKEWLSRNVTDDGDGVKFHQIYQVFTTVRAKIALGDYSSALLLMANLEKLVTNYRRLLDQMEIHVLRAIVLFKQRRRAEAVASIEEAVFLAQPYGFTRIFADEGAVIMPILQKLYNRFSGAPEKSNLATFVRTIQIITNENAASFPGLTSGLEENHVKLSKQQMRMLLFLSAGKNNRQICEETGLKLNTVKAHLYKLYEKLEVNSATDAVLKSYQLGVIERNATDE